MKEDEIIINKISPLKTNKNFFFNFFGKIIDTAYAKIICIKNI